MEKTDADIRQAIVEELRWDTRLDTPDIDVEVDGGVATLRGAVPSYAQRLAAHEAAQRVGGVVDVANELKVQIVDQPRRSDTDIAAAVRITLEWDVFVPEEHITSSVSDGWVTLEGTVDYWNQRDDAVRAIRNLVGVRGVTDKIEVKPPAKTDAVDVRKAIEEALARHAAHEAAGISLEVRDGQVSVSGCVNSWAEREAVIGAAAKTPGVRNVADFLRIEPCGS